METNEVTSNIGFNEINDHVKELIKDEISKPSENKIIKHSQVLENLLLEIKEIHFGDYLKIPDGETKQKHIIVGVVKYLLELAQEKKWNLCKTFDYTYIYNGAYWLQLDKDDLKKFLGDCATKMGCPEYESRHYEFKDKLLKQFLTDAHLPKPEPNPDKILINLKNGTFEFAKGKWELKPYNPNDFLTYQLPFEYEPKAKCPLFDKFLLTVLPDESSRTVLQEYSGYIFTKFNFEKMLMLIGGGANGKSVFFNVITALIGKENVLNYSMGTFNKENNRAKLVDVLLNYSSEKGTDLNPETFKALVSSEPLQARLLYGNSFTLYNKARFIINANKLPQETEQTEAYFRRWIIIPFETTISEAERDSELADKIISNELAGVFNWLLLGLERIVNNRKFTISEKSIQALADFRKQSDNVALFIEEMNIQSSISNKESIFDLYNQYKMFCKEDNYMPLGKNNFGKRFESKGFERARLNNGAAAFLIEKVSMF